MNNPQEIVQLAKLRLEEPIILYNNEKYDGAFYLAGYAVELALKSRICLLLDIPDLYRGGVNKNYLSFKTHDIKILLLLSGLRRKFEFDKGNDVNLDANWNLLSRTWNPECRYMSCGTKTKPETTDIISAIDDKASGVSTWIFKN